MNENIDKKIIINAISSYLMVFVSWLFLFNKENKYINNNFVKKHTKSALIIHLLLIINYIIFIYNWLWNKIEIFSIDLNIIIANVIFIGIISLFITWIYKAFKWEEFRIWEFIKTNKSISLDINNDSKFDEKDKLTIVLSYIPFIWYIVWSKFKNDKILDILKLNLFFSIIIFILYFFNYINLANLLLLSYIVFVSFIWVNLFTRDELIRIKLPSVFLPKSKLKFQKSILIYLRNYIKWDFKEFSIIRQEVEKKELEINNKNKEEIEKLENLKVNQYLIYIPIINFIFLKKINTKYRFHIINWLVISFLFITLLLLNVIWLINTKILILILFPITFGLWMLEVKNYRMPYIYEIYELYKKIINIFLKSKKEIEKRKKEIKEVSYKINKD